METKTQGQDVSPNDAKRVLAVRCNLSKDDEIALYEIFLDEFADSEGRLKYCNPDAIFNWFGWQLWRSKH